MKSEFEARRRLNDPAAALPFDLGLQLAVVLRDACDLDIPGVFFDLAAWAQTALVFREFHPTTMLRAIEAMHANVVAYVPADKLDAARAILGAALEELETVDMAEESAIDETLPFGPAARRFFDAMLDGDETRAAREALLSVAGGARIVDVYERLLTPVLREAGRLWLRDEINVSQEHVITAATERVMAQLIDLKPVRAHREFSVAVSAPGTAQHDVGARMVADAFALGGWHAAYLGANVPIEDVVQYADSVSVDVLALSATIARDITPIRHLIAELETRPIAPLVLVGGRAFSLHPSLWRAVGADGHAATPMSAVALASELVCHCDAE